MPPRKTKGKKRRKQKGGAAKLAQILKASARRQAKRARRGARSAARYARRNKGRIAAGLAAAGALGLGGLEGMRARQTYNLDREWPVQNKARIRGDYKDMESSIYHDEDYYIKERRRLQSPTGRFFRGVRNYPYKDIPRDVYRGAKAAPGRAYRGARKRAGKAYSGFMDLFKRKQTPSGQYGKRRRRKRKSSFGKKAKKPSAALRRLCKKHKVRLTVKRGGKRVYKSEAMLKKQCKKAMKKKK